MADLLAHVLVPYVLLTVADWRFDWLSERWVVVGMAGAAIPDLAKVRLVVPDALVERTLGVPFSYTPIGSLGGVLLIAAAIALAFERDRRRVYGLLVFGGFSALVVDGLRAFADGRADFWLYPLWVRPPTPGLYVSSDPWVAPTVAVVAAGVYAIDRRRTGRS